MITRYKSGGDLATLRIGIAGVGKLGRYHGQNLLQIPAAELVGVYDIAAERGIRVSEELGVQFYSSYDQLLKDVDAVSIAVPTRKHFELASEALQMGRSVFVEKPITATIAEARTLVDLANRQGLSLQVGHIERFNAAFRSLSTITLAPKFIEAHRLASFDPRGTDVAVVLDLMIHDIDLVLTLVHSPIRRIDANGVAVVSDNEDIANARIQFENGCVANLTASRISLKKMRKIRLFQPDMYLSLDLLLGQAELYRLQAIAPEQIVQSPVSWGIIEKDGVRKQILYEKMQPEEENALKLELQAFIEAVLNRNKTVVPGEDGLRALEVASLILAEIKKSAGN